MTSDYSHLPWHVKNNYLYVLIEQGALGGSLFVILMVTALIRLVRLSSDESAVPLLLATSLSGFALVGLLGSPLDMPRVAMMFYLALALSFTRVFRPAPRMQDETIPNVINVRRTVDPINARVKLEGRKVAEPGMMIEFSFRSRLELYIDDVWVVDLLPASAVTNNVYQTLDTALIKLQNESLGEEDIRRLDLVAEMDEQTQPLESINLYYREGNYRYTRDPLAKTADHLREVTAKILEAADESKP